MNKEISPNYIHSLDAQILNGMIKYIGRHNEEHHPIRHYCKECGKNEGHYIGCKESHN